MRPGMVGRPKFDRLKSSDVALLGGIAVLKALRTADFNTLKTQLQSLYASIPHDWHRNNTIANYEGHYASLFYSFFMAMGLAVKVEEAVATGKIDMVVTYNNTLFIFEFKVVETTATGHALAQIKAKHYAAKYAGQGLAIYLIGVEFSKASKNVVGFEVEPFGEAP